MIQSLKKKVCFSFLIFSTKQWFFGRTFFFIFQSEQALSPEPPTHPNFRKFRNLYGKMDRPLQWSVPQTSSNIEGFTSAIVLHYRLEKLWNTLELHICCVRISWHKKINFSAWPTACPNNDSNPTGDPPSMSIPIRDYLKKTLPSSIYDGDILDHPCTPKSANRQSPSPHPVNLRFAWVRWKFHRTQARESDRVRGRRPWLEVRGWSRISLSYILLSLPFTDHWSAFKNHPFLSIMTQNFAH